MREDGTAGHAEIVEKTLLCVLRVLCGSFFVDEEERWAGD
jgi:hypothetical protein